MPSWINQNKDLLLKLAGVFILVFGVYLSNIFIDYNKNLETGRTRRLMTSSDQVPNTFLPYLILKHGTLDFTSIKKHLKSFDNNNENPYFLLNTGSAYYSVYPVITGFLALPIYLVPIILNKIPNLDTHLNILKVLFLGRVAAAFYASLSCALFYFILDKISKNKTWITIFTLFYAFGTTTWSISSRGLWMHTTAQVVISLVLLLLILSLKNQKYIPWIGFLLGFAVLIKPTNVLLALGVTFYIALYKRDWLAKFILFAFPTAIFMLFYNILTFGGPLTEGYAARGDMLWSTPFSESLPALLYSPARSFLFISPPLVLSFWGIFKVFIKKKRDETDKILAFLGISFITTFLMFAKWWAWDGANGFGYRMLTEFLPVIGLFAFIETEKLKYRGKALIIILMVYSIFIHFNAVFFRKSRCDHEHNWSFYCLMPPKEPPKY